MFEIIYNAVEITSLTLIEPNLIFLKLTHLTSNNPTVATIMFTLCEKRNGRKKNSCSSECEHYHCPGRKRLINLDGTVGLDHCIF